MKVFCQRGFKSGWVQKTWNDDMTLASCSTHQIILMKEHFKLQTQDASAMFHIRSHKTSKMFCLPKTCLHFSKKSKKFMPTNYRRNLQQDLLNGPRKNLSYLTTLATYLIRGPFRFGQVPFNIFDGNFYILCMFSVQFN